MLFVDTEDELNNDHKKQVKKSIIQYREKAPLVDQFKIKFKEKISIDDTKLDSLFRSNNTQEQFKPGSLS